MKKLIKHFTPFLKKMARGSLLILCLTFAGCSGGDDYNSEKKEDDPGKKTETLSIDARPTDWVRVNTNINPMASLSLTISQPDLSQYSAPADSGTWKDDLMATFVGGTCRGVSGPFQNDATSSYQSDITSDILFLPPVVGLTTDDADVNKTVTIKYYSGRLRHIFTATSPYPLKNDVEAYGTRTNPLTLTWEK